MITGKIKQDGKHKNTLDINVEHYYQLVQISYLWMSN